MTNMVPPVGTPKRIGFISTRFHGTDGVTLEARKWAQILEGMGHTCYWMAGQLDAPVERSYLAPLAFFNHPEVATLQSQLFGVPFRTRAITNQIQKLKERLKDDLYHFIRKFNLEVLVPENILAIPMHVPLGLAMTEVIAETPIPVIAHHHDFAWERERFTLNGVNDYLAAAFPPAFFAMYNFKLGTNDADVRMGVNYMYTEVIIVLVRVRTTNYRMFPTMPHRAAHPSQVYSVFNALSASMMKYKK